MRFLIPAAFLAGVIALGTLVLVVDPEPARAQDQKSRTELTTSGRIDSGKLGTMKPAWFGSKWWKKFARAMKRFIDFISGLVDDLTGHPGDKPGGPLGFRNSGPCFDRAHFETPLLL